MGFLIGNVFVDELLNVLRSEIFLVFVILVLGYALGRVSIKGVSLGSSGVFIVALAAGIFLYFVGDDLGFYGEGITSWIMNSKGELNGGAVSSAIKNLGLAMFVTGIGFISGPTFIRNFKKKAFSYITIGVTAVMTGTLLAILFIAVDKTNLDAATGAGLLMGGLSSTPGLASALAVFSAEKGVVAAASGLTYPFSVLGIVLFVQLMPKILRKNMNEEVRKLKESNEAAVKIIKEAVATENAIIKPVKERFKFDSLGLCVFAAAVVLGMILGGLTIPLGANTKFNLGITGGALIMGLLFGHFGRIGNISLEVPKTTLNPIREIGLVLFLTGSGLEGGLKMFSVFGTAQMLVLLAYGAVITIAPMIVVFFIGRYVFKLELLNNLGSITGGMTSTPALGALIHTSKTDEVAQPYAATYPIALFLLVLVPQIISLIF